MGKRKTRKSKHARKSRRKRPIVPSFSGLAEPEPIIDVSAAPALVQAVPLILSRRYGFVRSRQLEGTFPGEPETGIWPVTAKRISYGWGAVSTSAWPDSVNDGQWPPDEPEGIDRAAKRMRSGHYQRVRTLQDCRVALVSNQFPIAVIQVTEAWFHAEKGMISEPSPDDEILGSHAVTLVGYDDNTQGLRFRNSSWGPEWGDDGFGTLSYTHYEDRAFETWISFQESPTRPLAQTSGSKSSPGNSGDPSVRELEWGVRDILQGGIVHVCEIYDVAHDERVGWAFAVPRDGFLDVEELFIRPPYRRRGYAKRLCRLLLKRSEFLHLPLRLWVSYADCGQENRPALEGVLRNLGLYLGNSSVRWAAYVALVSPSGQPLKPIIVPDRPAMNRGRWKVASVLLASSLALAPPGGSTPSQERDSTAISQRIPSESLVPLPDQSAAPQDEDELLPGVEYNIVLTAPPHESTKYVAVVTKISRGRCDLPLSDSDWAGILIEDDEG